MGLIIPCVEWWFVRSRARINEKSVVHRCNNWHVKCNTASFPPCFITHCLHKSTSFVEIGLSQYHSITVSPCFQSLCIASFISWMSNHRGPTGSTALTHFAPLLTFHKFVIPNPLIHSIFLPLIRLVRKLRRPNKCARASVTVRQSSIFRSCWLLTNNGQCATTQVVPWGKQNDL